MNDFLNIQNDWFHKKYFKKLKKRYFTFKIALNFFLQYDWGAIVETGCIRQKDDWGAGNSTYILGDFCKRHGKHLYTVDNNQEHLDLARRETSEFGPYIIYELDDSVEYLKNFDSKIGFLYLDSLDCDPKPSSQNIQAQQHALKEIKAAYDKLTPHAIVLIDDNLFVNQGKAKLVKKYLQRRDWTLLLDYKQSLWIR